MCPFRSLCFMGCINPLIIMFDPTGWVMFTNTQGFIIQNLGLYKLNSGKSGFSKKFESDFPAAGKSSCKTRNIVVTIGKVNEYNLSMRFLKFLNLSCPIAVGRRSFLGTTSSTAGTPFRPAQVHPLYSYPTMTLPFK